MNLNFEVLNNIYAIYRFETDAQLPEWIYQSEFYSVTQTSDEISVVTQQNASAKADIEKSENWRILKMIGPLDFSLVGIIADITGIMKQEQISIFTLSTFDTDYILIKENNLEKAIEALINNNYNLISQL